MQMSARWLRAALGCAVLVLGAPAMPAQAGTSCVTTSGTPSCQFSCDAGDTLVIEVGGPLRVQGNAQCGGASVHCVGNQHCVDGPDTSSSAGTGFCDLTEGTWARCTTGGPLAVPEPCDIADFLCTVYEIVEDALRQLDPVLCTLLATLSPGVPGVVDITPEGDVYVLGTLVWDCPPYQT